MKRTGPVFLLSVIVAALVPLVNNSGNGSVQTAYAQTNAGALATLGASGATANSTTTGHTTEGLQIKREVNYFDSASGYLVYPSTANNTAVTTGSKKLPAVIMVHEFWGLNDNIRSMANTLAKQAGDVVLAVDLFEI